MNEPTQFAARLIEAGAPGYAAAAAERLVERHPETAERFGAGAFRAWQEHLEQRLRELATALMAGEAELLASEVVWSRLAFEDRDVPLDDLRASLVCLNEVLAEELPAAAGPEPAAYLDRAIEGLDAENEPRRSEISDDTPEGRLALAYLEAGLSGDRQRAVATVLEAVDGGLPLMSAYRSIMDAEREVGEMWHAGEVVVAQEHFVTATTLGLMTLLGERAGAGAAAHGKSVMVTVAPGEGHYLVARLLANLFEHRGWRTIHLAGGMPAEELALGCEAFGVDLLVLSLTVATRLRATIEAIEEVRARCPGIKVMIGGRAVTRSPAIRERLGADICAENVDQALAMADQLVGLEPSAD